MKNRRWDRWAVALLVMATLATRLPMLQNVEGEPDTGLFIEGLWRWMSYGPHVPEIYGKNLSPGYYWSLAHIFAWLKVQPAHFPLAMNCLSVAASVTSAPLLYWIGRRFLPPLASFVVALIFLLGPGAWWMGIEPHPEGVAICLFFAAVVCFLRGWEGGQKPALGWMAGATAFLAATLLFRGDMVLMFGVFPALVMSLLPARRWQRYLRPALAIGGMLAGASVLFIAARSGMLHQTFGATQAYSEQQTGGYLKYGLLQMAHSKAYILKQLMPIAVAEGLVATLLAAVGGWLAFRRWGFDWGQRWLWLLLGWSVPSAIFWFLILGNNVRHVTLLALPLLWAGSDAALRWGGERALAAAAAVALVFDPVILPASSNITIYASGDVPGSARALHARQADLRADLDRMVAQSTRPAGRLDAAFALDARVSQIPACFLGSYSTPYLVSFALMQDNRLDAPGAKPYQDHAVGMRVGAGWSDIFVNDGAGQHWMRFYEMYSEDEYAQLRPGCDTAYSAEYDGNGYHQRFLGKEWRTVPLQAIWYPPRVPRRPRANR